MAELKVPAEIWDKLDEFHKGKIEGILLATGSLRAGDTISSDSTVPHKPDKVRAFDLDVPILGDIGKGICQAGCAAAGASAAAACATITDGIASAACYAAAAAATEECKKHC
ncbi:conserved hypothetical protein [Paraburkholderia tropica]|uniref:hypothetical protein n=1 Tax=Paraburkholderia tropica TaxID=92647 RepID=UPI001CB35001|nr:hypothetical protein [Paraburkholderia tropica]CAG9235873.1 conserved hypothetical protein [Paraburkholderia tropica]